MKVTKRSFFSTKAYLCNKKKIESMGEFISHIEYLKHDWNEEYLWYRGVSKATHKLIPGIYRPDVWHYRPELAEEMFFEFMRRAKAFVNRKYATWEWYHTMQHYGLPTRLLDWTEGSLTALFFSVKDLRSVKVPTVWVIDPYHINELCVGDASVFYTDPDVDLDEDERRIVNRYIEDHKKLPEYPLCILPPYIDDRIRVQRSCFTVHGKYKDGFYQMKRKFSEARIAKLSIDTKSAPNIRSELASSGINEATLFPDLEGIAREIKYEYIEND
ncbi:MAG TPA: FRG domain-containing protein [Syntrophales bacterium]|nr:FRG domain-containing protein [Syntrophales bacterium]